LAPAGTPPAVLTRLETEFSKIVAMPEMQKQFADWGLAPLPLRREAYRELIATDIAKWRKVIAQVGGIKPE
jgi:tripartite-type tricarboxylate transporter receptor subunit TctC